VWLETGSVVTNTTRIEGFDNSDQMARFARPTAPVTQSFATKRNLLEEMQSSTQKEETLTITVTSLATPPNLVVSWRAHEEAHLL
jgi:hypothetical protein